MYQVRLETKTIWQNLVFMRSSSCYKHNLHGFSGQFIQSALQSQGLSEKLRTEQRSNGDLRKIEVHRALINGSVVGRDAN